MQPMSTFNPEKPCRAHDRLNDRTVEWRTDWAELYRRMARTDKADGMVGRADPRRLEFAAGGLVALVGRRA